MLAVSSGSYYKEGNFGKFRSFAVPCLYSCWPFCILTFFAFQKQPSATFGKLQKLIKHQIDLEATARYQEIHIISVKDLQKSENCLR